MRVFGAVLTSLALLLLCGSVRGRTNLKVPIENDVEVKRVSSRHAAEYIVIAADQRSGSSELALGLSKHPCILHGNEIFFTGGQDRLNAHTLTEYTGRTARKMPRDYLEAAHKALEEKWGPGLDPVCNGELTIAIKVFPIHAVNLTSFTDFMRRPSTLVVVVERDMTERFCSLKHAKLFHDWGTTPKRHKKSGDLASFKEECAAAVKDGSNPEMFGDYEKFVERHSNWYKYVRSSLTGGKVGRMHLEVSFAALINEPDPAYHDELIRAMWLAAGVSNLPEVVA